MATKSHDSQPLRNFVKNFCSIIKRHIIFIGTLIFCVLGLFTTYYSMYLASAISISELGTLLIIGAVLTIILFLVAIVIVWLTYREMRPNINKEVIDRVDLKLQCQTCMSEMFEIQKRFYNVELESFV